MQPSDFTHRAPGNVVRHSLGYCAFIPDPLPPALEPTWRLARLCSEAEAALGELAGLGHYLPNPHLLIGPFIRREAVSSSRIEGTRASFSDLLLYEAAPSPTPQPRDVREVSNYVSALEYGLARLTDLPVSLRLIREVHAQLLSGLPAAHLTPGEFRRSQNWIGPPGCTLADATHVPPPPEEMRAALGELERYVHAPMDLPYLVRLALIHYQFEAIHPFLDGNGRVGRLLITLLLCAEGRLPQPLLYLSAFFEQHRRDYYDLLLGVSRGGAWEEWLEFFLRGVRAQSRDALERARRLMDLWRHYRDTVAGPRSSGALLRLVDHLFASPAVSAAGAARSLSITPRAVQGNIEKLVAAGILREVTGRQRGRVYVAQEIVDIAEATTPE